MRTLVSIFRLYSHYILRVYRFEVPISPLSFYTTQVWNLGNCEHITLKKNAREHKYELLSRFVVMGLEFKALYGYTEVG